MLLLLFIGKAAQKIVDGQGVFIADQQVTQWKSQGVNIGAFTSSAPDSMTIIAYSSSAAYDNNALGLHTKGNNSSLYLDAFAVSNGPVGIDENVNNIAVKVFPNPATNIINFKVNSTDKIKIELYYILGKNIYAGTYRSSNQLTLDVSSYNSGFYFYKVIDAKGAAVKTGKFTVK